MAIPRVFVVLRQFSTCDVHVSWWRVAPLRSGHVHTTAGCMLDRLACSQARWNEIRRKVKLMDSAIYIAVCAAVVATVGAAWQIRQRIADRPILKVEAGFAYGGGPPPKEMISVTIANTGSGTATVHEAGLKFGDGATFPYLPGTKGPPGIAFPARIEGFDQTTIFFDQELLKPQIENRGSYPGRCYARIGGGKMFQARIKTKAIRSWFGDFDSMKSS